MTMRLLIGDITKLDDVDVIVNAANGIGVMGAGVAGAISRTAGQSFREAVRAYGKENGPFEAGSVYSIDDSGLLKKTGIKKVYHAVTMKFPGTESTIESVTQSIRECCRKAISEGYKSIAFPGLGTGIGTLGKKQVAYKMVRYLSEFQSRIKITIVDIDREYIGLCKEAIESRIENGYKNEPNETNSGVE